MKQQLSKFCHTWLPAGSVMLCSLTMLMAAPLLPDAPTAMAQSVQTTQVTGLVTDKQKEPLNYYLKYLKIITVSENSGKVLNLYYPCPSPSTDTQTHRHTDAQTPLQYRLPLLGFSLFFFLPFLLFLQTQILHRFSVLLV